MLNHFVERTSPRKPGAASHVKRQVSQASMSVIHTLNSRDHIMLEMLRDHFGVGPDRMRREIQIMHAETVEVLASKKIDYARLRSALVPSMDKYEAVFLFDSTECKSELYGREVFDHLLPLLDQRTTQSILVGDLLGDDQDLIFDILKESLTLSRTFIFRHATLLFGVYINSLTPAALQRLHSELGTFSAYLGFIPTTFLSRAKVYISTSMAGFLVKHGKRLIIAHEPDRSNAENINIARYNLEQFGYEIASVQSDSFHMFLKYKIERPVFSGDQSDIELALNAISNNVQPLRDFTVQLDEAKHGYLINEKLGKLKKAGLENSDRSMIESIIQAKVSANYIYSMDYLREHDVMKFNIMLELGRTDGYPTRLTAALEYMPDAKMLRVITLH